MDSKPVIDMDVTFTNVSFSETSTVSVNDDRAEADATASEPVADDAPVRPFAYREPIGRGISSGLSHPNRRRSDAVTRGK